MCRDILQEQGTLHFGPFKPHEVPKDPLYKSVQIPLNSLQSFRHLSSTVCVTDEDIATSYLMFIVFFSVEQGITYLIQRL